VATLEYLVKATDASSAVFQKIALSADHLDKQLGDLSKRIATPEVDLKDAKFTLGMVNAAKRLDKLSAMVADPAVEVDTAKAQTEILRITAMLDRLDGKEVTVDVDRRGGIFARLGRGAGGILGGIGGGASAAGGAIGGLGSALGPSGMGAAIAAAIAGAATLTPALLPLGLGGLVGGGAALGGLKLGSDAFKQLQALQKQLRGVTGTTAASQAARQRISGQIAALRGSQGTQIRLGEAGADVTSTLSAVFMQALTSRGPGEAGHPGAPSFLASLTGILKQIAGFIKSIGPGLGDLFRASVPYLKLFVHFLEQAAKVLLPVFTESLKEMKPFLPLIAQGLMQIVQGFAGFIKAIGPAGMQASAKIFVFLTKVMAGAMVGLGHAINWLAEHVPTWVHNIAAWWDRLRHWTDVAFTRMRHDIAAIWDAIFSNSIGRVIRGGHDIEREFNAWRHGIAVIFDGVRHDIARAWDLIYNNTIGAVIRIIRGVVSWFKKLPGQVLAAMKGLGTALFSFGKQALNDFLNGLKSVGSSILGWIKNFIGGIPGALLKLLHMSPPHPGSVFFELGANIMRHFEAGIKSRAQSARASLHAATNPGAGVPPHGSLQAYAMALLRAYGWGNQWAAFNDIVMRESGWRWNATNPTSGAYGIPQALPAGKMASAGADWRTNPFTQLRWMMSYLRSRWGSPAAADANEIRAHWYGTGFHGLVDRPTIFGAGEAGAERVDITPAGQRATAAVQFGDINVYNATDEAMIRQKLSFAVVAAGLGS
jgi:hypothetical protein